MKLPSYLVPNLFISALPHSLDVFKQHFGGRDITKSEIFRGTVAIYSEMLADRWGAEPEVLVAKGERHKSVEGVRFFVCNKRDHLDEDFRSKAS